MDVHIWASRVHSAKHLTSMQAARLQSENYINLDDYEGDDEVRACFPCPFCYVDVEVSALCAHLQEEHCFDVKNAVCPVCAANLGKDMLGHFTVQHSHLLKRRKKSQISSLWTNNSAILGKELRELSSFLGVNSTNGRGSTPDSAPDPLLSPFLFNITLQETKGNQDKNSSNEASTTCDMTSTESCTVRGDRDQEFEERSQRAEFFQQMILSTIF